MHERPLQCKPQTCTYFFEDMNLIFCGRTSDCVVYIYILQQMPLKFLIHRCCSNHTAAGLKCHSRILLFTLKPRKAIEFNHRLIESRSNLHWKSERQDAGDIFWYKDALAAYEICPFFSFNFTFLASMCRSCPRIRLSVLASGPLSFPSVWNRLYSVLKQCIHLLQSMEIETCWIRLAR